MDRNALIGSIAARYLTDQLNTEDEGILRFCLVGLSQPLVVSIAKAVLSDLSLNTHFEVHIPRAYARHGELPEAILTDEAAAHWRHTPPADPNRRGVMFAVTDSEAEQIGKTIGDLPRLDTSRLREMRQSWLAHVGLTADAFPEEELKAVEAALLGLEASSLVVNIERFADYVLAIGREVLHECKDMLNALDSALPALRLPRNSGSFRSIPPKKQTWKSAWQAAFNRLDREVRSYLFKLTPKQGEPIPPEHLRQELEKLKSCDNWTLTEEQEGVVRDFIDAELRPDQWALEQAALVALHWPDIEPIFKGVTKRRDNLNL